MNTHDCQSFVIYSVYYLHIPCQSLCVCVCTCVCVCVCVCVLLEYFGVIGHTGNFSKLSSINCLSLCMVGVVCLVGGYKN